MSSNDDLFVSKYRSVTTHAQKHIKLLMFEKIANGPSYDDIHY